MRKAESFLMHLPTDFYSIKIFLFSTFKIKNPICQLTNRVQCISPKIQSSYFTFSTIALNASG